MPKIKDYIEKLENDGNLHQGFLLSEENKKLEFEWFKNTDAVKHSKEENKENNAQYSFIRDENGKIFAIYNPSQQKDGIANGAFGIVKIAQNIETGEWCLVKIQKIPNKGKHTPTGIQKMRQEKYFLQKSNLLHGYQERINNDKNCFISYTFMTELPGSPIVDARTPEQGFAQAKRQHLTKQEQLVILKNCLIRLYELQQAKIIHRDLSPQNILIADDLQVYFIDWGTALEANSLGFCQASPPQLGAGNKQIRYANGYDFITLLDSFAELNLFDNAEIRSEILKIKQICGDAKKGYNPIELESLIKKVNNLLEMSHSISHIRF